MTTARWKTHFLCSCALLATAFAGPTAVSQDRKTHSLTPEKVTVTADSARSYDNGLEPLTLNNSAKLSTEESLQELANVTAVGGTNRTRFLTIRGQGELGTFEQTPTHSISHFINEIDVTGVLSVWPQMNVRALRVLPGSQSVERGGFSSAGSMQTELQSGVDPAVAQVSAGTFKELQAGGAVPVTKSLRVFSLGRVARGPYRNQYTGDYGAAQKELYVSVVKSWWHSDRLQVESSHIGAFFDNAYDVWSIDNTFTTQSDRPGKDRLGLLGHSLIVSYGLSDRLKLRSVTSFTQSTSRYSYDSDWGNNELWRSKPGWGQNYDYFDQYDRKRFVGHQRVELVGASWNLGLHAYGMQDQLNIKNQQNEVTTREVDSKFKTTNLAVIAGKSVRISEVHGLHFRGRLERQNLSYRDEIQNRYTQRADLNAWSAAWTSTWSSTQQSQFSLSQGFKSPGFNVGTTLPQQFRNYAAERVDTAELSHKMYGRDSSLSLGVFVQNQTRKQVNLADQADPTDPSTFIFFTSATAKGESWGAELAGRKQFGKWSGEGTAGFLQTQFKNYSYAGKDLSGRSFAHAPTWTVSASVAYQWTPRTSVLTWINGRDRFYFSNSDANQSRAYAVGNLGVKTEGENWQLMVFVKNLTDKRYATRGYIFGVEPPDYPTKLYQQQGAPSELGLTLTHTW